MDEEKCFKGEFWLVKCRRNDRIRIPPSCKTPSEIILVDISECIHHLSKSWWEIFITKKVDHTQTHWLIFFHEACEILVSWPGIEPRPLAVKAQHPNHWTTREVPTPINLNVRHNQAWCTFSTTKYSCQKVKTWSRSSL